MKNSCKRKGASIASLSMADSIQNTSSLDCIPEIFLERRSVQSTHRSQRRRRQKRREGADPEREQPTAEDSNDDLVKEGFISFNELKLHHLPEAIRTQENLDRILSIGERVVCVNNNKLSKERNLEEEMKTEGMFLNGTGFVLDMGFSCDVSTVTVFTNRHVLYNVDEIRESTVDFFFDSYRARQQARKMERTKRGNGRYANRQNSKVDFCIASYDLDRKSKTAFDQMKLMNEHLLISSSKSAAKSEKSLGKGIVCVISHPLGRWKHVSFGKIVTCRPKDNVFLYDAPTKPGSSGAPIIVFGSSALQIPPESLFYHEGVDGKTNLKIGHVEVNFQRFIAPRLFRSNQEDFMKCGYEKDAQKGKQYLNRLSYDEIRPQAQIYIQSSRLGAFFPIFAAFILHPEKYCSLVFTLPRLPPCQSLSERDVELCDVDKKYMSWRLLAWARVKSSLFPPPISETAEPGADLSPFLTTEAPCWCQAIVEAVVHNSRSDKDSGVFLRPDTVCGDFEENPFWPWSMDGCGESCGPGREPMLKHCLLKECLDVFRGTTWEREVPLQLLVLIHRANDIVKQSSSETPQTQHGCPGFTEESSQSSARRESNVKQASTTRRTVSSSDLKQLKVTSDVFNSLHEIAPKLTVLSFWTQGIIPTAYRQIFRPGCPGDECVKKFFRALNLISHIRHHFYFDHPDSLPSQGVPWPRSKCPCGRPAWGEVPKASAVLSSISENMLESKLAARGEKKERPIESPLLDGPCCNEKPTRNVSFDSLFGKSFIECTSTPGAVASLEFFLSRIDSLDNFRNSCDLFSIGLASSEVFLFNSRSLLRQYRQHLSPFYVSSPVSVFGRPGRWAGGHTPEEVKNTAWKLIRAACAESRFGRECLEVLERDTARREKLIDLYVDMKQLKFSGDIDEEKMTVEYLETVHAMEKNKEEIVSVMESVEDNPTYFVMKTFLKLFPIPSWDWAWQMVQSFLQR